MLSNEFPAHLQKALRELRQKFESQTDVARREYVRKCLKAHEFFRGNQYLWWDVRAGEYRAPTQTGGLMAGNTPSQMQSLYTINIYQGFAMSMIAILTANHPTKRFFPLRAGDANDQAASEKFNAYLKIYEKQTDEFEKLMDEVYLLWCDGTFGSYIHTVADGSRFGWIEEPVYDTVPTQVGYDTYKCVVCGNTYPTLGNGMCPDCGAPYSDSSVIPAPVVMQQKQVGTNQIPKTRVQVDTVGGLELKLPPMAKNMGEYPYLIRARELPKAMIRSAYPEIADKIQGAPSGGLDGSIEKRARLQTAQGSTVENRAVYANTSQDVTFRETWFRPWSFFEIDDENLRQELLNAFPDGCYYAEANDTFCEIRPEKMDDKWRICHAMPGRGQLREPIGGSLIQIQEIYNDVSNLVRDVIEYTLPSTFVDNEVLDVKRWARSNVMAGAAYNVRARPGRAVQDAFWQTQPGQLPQYTGQMLADMRGEIPQFTAGLFPASFGGGTPGNGTAAIDVDTPIPTPSGFVRNGDLKAGDKVFGEDGKPHDVLVAHKEYEADSYRVVFDDGSWIVADAGHRWKTLTSKDREQIGNRSDVRRQRARSRRRASGSMPANTGPKPKPLPEPTFKTTEQVLASLNDRRGRSNHAIPVTLPVDMPEADLPVDPWVLGVWLGDGSSAHGMISCADSDGPGMAEEFARAGYELRRLKSPYTWYAQGLRPKLRRLGVLNNKHVPEAYLTASRKQRLALLQGLMDTDGCATTDGKQFFSNTNYQLIQSAYRLAASLGCKPRIVETKPGVVSGSSEDKPYVRRAGWCVYWSNGLDVFRMKRKSLRVNKSPKRDARKYRYIVAVEPVGKRTVRCITVSNPTECFLVGDNFICTGNSGIAQERDAAMGRIGIFWRMLKKHHAEIAPLIVKEFSQTGLEPVSMTEETEGGSLVSITVAPEDLKQGDVQTYAETVEDYPTSWPQRQGLLMSLMANPLFQQAISKLANLKDVKQTLGIDFEMPGEQAYKDEWAIIEQLITQPPLPPGPPDPMTGMPGQPQSTIMPGPLDDNAAMLEACMDFDQSDRGQALRASNSPGYQNFILHALARKAALAPPPLPAPPAGPNGPPAPGEMPPAGPPPMVQ